MSTRLVDAFDHEFKSKFEFMKPEDIAQFYYCFTKIGFAGTGPFYKYL